MHVYIKYMYIAVYLRYHVSLLVNINIFYMTPQRATWKNSYYMLNVLPSLNKVLLLLLLLLLLLYDMSVSNFCSLHYFIGMFYKCDLIVHYNNLLATCR